MGSREVEITSVDLVGASGNSSHMFQSGEGVEIRLRVRANQSVSDFAFGVGIFNTDGVCCYGTNTLIEGATAGELSGDGEVRFVIDRLDLVEGTYKLDVAVIRQKRHAVHYHRLLYTFRVKSTLKEAGFPPPHRWSFSGGIRITVLMTSSGTPASIPFTRRRSLRRRPGARRNGRIEPRVCSICFILVTCVTCATPGALAMRSSSA